MSNPHLSVVIPAYNEKNRIPDTLADVARYLQKQTYSSEILIVDDGSKDDTAEEVKHIASQIQVRPDSVQRVELLQYPDKQNRGKGYAVRYGLQRAKGEYRMFMDADNSTTIDHVEQFFPFFKQGYDVVIGSRDIQGANVAVRQSWIKELAGRGGNMFIRAVAVRGVYDTQAGFKMLTARATDAIVPVLTIDRWGFDVEILAVARLKGFRIKETPITWINDEESKVSASAYLQVLGEVVRIRMNIIKKIYDGAQKEKNAE